MCLKMKRSFLHVCVMVIASTLWASAQADLNTNEELHEETSSASMFGFESNEAEIQEETPRYTPPKKISLEQRVLQQGEKIAGLISVVEGLSASLYELQQAEEKRKISNEDQIALQKLISRIDEINATYVSKEELKRLMEDQKSLPAKADEVQASSPSVTASNEQLYSEAVRLYMKQSYDDAKERFLVTANKGYKPAASHYYLGEIAYYTKHYEEAIGYFKKSAGLYDKASYIDTLLFHTAVSLENSGKKDEAKAFYQNIVENYQGKKTAKLSQDRLKRL
ncbi:MAG: hypothetical protein RL113_210 [Pseudomonadota bacterium]